LRRPGILLPPITGSLLGLRARVGVDQLRTAQCAAKSVQNAQLFSLYIYQIGMLFCICLDQAPEKQSDTSIY